MSKSIYITDSDFLIAQIMKSDIHHQKAIKISKSLVKNKVKVFYPSVAIIEAATTIQRKYNNPKLAHALLNIFKDPDLQVTPIDHETIMQVASNFNPGGSKQNTPFDYTILSLAKITKAEVILSFDEFYRKKGFKTASDL